MNESVVERVTKPTGRRWLYHFTRRSNLPAIARLDSLLASSTLRPDGAGERRLAPIELAYEGFPVTINSHLRIAPEMLAPSTTLEEFRACLDRHVFFWPTLAECRKMIGTYTRREPEEAFAVLVLNARTLLVSHYNEVKLSKYDSGSSPRFPHLCSYRKSPEMFLPLARFGSWLDPLVPTKASEIKEVLVEKQVTEVARYLEVIYTDGTDQLHSELPDRWRGLIHPLGELK